MRATPVDDIAGRTRPIAEARSDVVLVYLFGSQVEGRVGPMSDVDVAVLLERGTTEYTARSELAHAFSAALDGAPVDLIILNRAPVELAYAVIAQGVVLFERDLASRVEYEAGVLSLYGDFLPYLRAQRESILTEKNDERRIQRYREALGRIERALGASGASAESASR